MLITRPRISSVTSFCSSMFVTATDETIPKPRKKGRRRTQPPTATARSRRGRREGERAARRTSPCRARFHEGQPHRREERARPGRRHHQREPRLVEVQQRRREDGHHRQVRRAEDARHGDTTSSVETRGRLRTYRHLDESCHTRGTLVAGAARALLRRLTAEAHQRERGERWRRRRGREQKAAGEAERPEGESREDRPSTRESWNCAELSAMAFARSLRPTRSMVIA